MKKLKIEATERGFLCAKFTDRSGQDCSIQEGEGDPKDFYCIWLGVDDDRGLASDYANGPVRMHLTQNQVEALLPLLKKFVESGRLR